MNALTPIPASSPAPRPIKRRSARRSDQEFLAPAIEILESPPSPVRLALLSLICIFVVTALVWAYVGRVDIIATAAGKIEPSGKVKILQPLQSGKVTQILVENGDHVTAGQIIVTLDDTDAKSQLDDLSGQLTAFRAEILRRQAAIDFVTSIAQDSPVKPMPAIAWSPNIPDEVRTREQDVLDKDIGQLEAELASTESQIAQKSGDAGSIAVTVAAQQSLVDTLQQLASMRETLVDQEAGSKADWLDALQTLKIQQVTLATDQSQQGDNLSSIEVLHRDEDKARAGFLSDYGQKLDDAEKQADDLEQKIRQAQSVLDAMTLHSPIDGVVQASTVTTVGQIVSSGQELLRVVPSAPALEVEAYLPNEDTGFVDVGQTADIKVAAFPYTQYGTISGTVTKIGKDALSAADAAQAAADPTHAPAAQGSAGTADSTDGLVFPISVKLASTSIVADGGKVELSPGMAVTVEINTGSRRILEYLFSPMVEVTSSAMRER